MKIMASTILSFYTGRAYCLNLESEFVKLLSAVTKIKYLIPTDFGDMSVQFRELLLRQCPIEFQDIAISWEHAPDWEQRIKEIDERFGYINIENVDTAGTPFEGAGKGGGA